MALKRLRQLFQKFERRRRAKMDVNVVVEIQLEVFDQKLDVLACGLDKVYRLDAF